MAAQVHGGGADVVAGGGHSGQVTLSHHVPDCANPRGWRCSTKIARCRVGIRILEMRRGSRLYKPAAERMRLSDADEALVEKALARVFA